MRILILCGDFETHREVKRIMIVDVDFDLARNERHGNATRRPNGGKLLLRRRFRMLKSVSYTHLTLPTKA